MKDIPVLTDTGTGSLAITCPLVCRNVVYIKMWYKVFGSSPVSVYDVTVLGRLTGG